MYETVAAVSTPYGKGGIAVIRISGDEASGIADRVFFPACGKPLSALPFRTEHFGYIMNGDKKIDSGMAVLFRAPASFTGEDTVEISCHGGILVTELVLAAVFSAGARPAPAGEFTRRAFLNGKLTLSAAEAVADLIDAHSEEMLRLSEANAAGSLAREINEIYAQTQECVAACFVDADFPDEQLSGMNDEELMRRLTSADGRIKSLLSTYRLGRAVSEGIDTVIIGKPNTGKSSLLNMMCGSERAIVTDVAGTTRDVLEERVCVGRVTLRLSDTAGLRPTGDRVESIGVERARRRMQEAELVLAVFDMSSPLDRYDARLIEEVRSLSSCRIAVINKTDLPPKMDPCQLGDVFDKTVYISAALGTGKEKLFSEIESLYSAGEIDYDTQATVANARQYAALCGAHESLESAIRALRDGAGADIAALDAEAALVRLGETDGRSVSEGVVNEIFGRFCVGK